MSRCPLSIFQSVSDFYFVMHQCELQLGHDGECDARAIHEGEATDD